MLNEENCSKSVLLTLRFAPRNLFIFVYITAVISGDVILVIRYTGDNKNNSNTEYFARNLEISVVRSRTTKNLN